MTKETQNLITGVLKREKATVKQCKAFANEIYRHGYKFDEARFLADCGLELRKKTGKYSRVS